MKNISVYFFIPFLLSWCSTIAIAQNSQKPILTKLPFAFSDIGRTPMENTPVLFNSRLLLVSNNRPGGADAKGKDAYVYIDDLQTGKEVARFGQGHSFVSAYVNGKELNVFALEFTDFGRIMKSSGIDRLTSTDLKTWKTEKVILPDGNEHLFNSSVCKDDKGYLMAWVPTISCALPDAISSSTARRWAAVSAPVSSLRSTRLSASRLSTVFQCWSARTSVGAIMAAWVPAAIATSMA